MMLQEAIKIMNETHPAFKLISVVDYDNYFVFNIEPKRHDRETNGAWIGGLIAIDKLFKVPMHFHPLMHNSKAFAKAVENNMHIF